MTVLIDLISAIDNVNYDKLFKRNNLYKNKHIPHSYIFNSEENRLKLLKAPPKHILHSEYKIADHIKIFRKVIT